MRSSIKPNLSRGRAGTGGFTLIETSMATVIIGVGVLAMVDAQSAFIVSNQWSSHAASATFLANEIRELTRNLPRTWNLRFLLYRSDCQFLQLRCRYF